MAVAFDAKVTATTDNNSTATISNATLTVGTGSNRALIAFIGFSAAAVPAGLTCVWDPSGANQAMTSIVARSGPLGGDSVAIFGLVNPTSGNKTLTASWTGSGEAHLAAASFTGVDQTGGATSFPNSTSSDHAAATSGTVAVTSAAGNMVVACFNQHSNFFASTSGTTISLDTTATGNDSIGTLYDTGAATVTCTATWTGGASTTYAVAACDILAATVVSAVAVGIPQGDLFQPGRRTGPTRGLRSTPAFPPDIVVPPVGRPAFRHTIFIPTEGPSRGLTPTRAFPPSPAALLIGPAAYNVTGATIGLGDALPVGAGAYAYSGAAVTLDTGFNVGSGAYASTGFPVGLGAGLNVGAGAYAVTGAAVQLDVGMAVSAGAYVYTGAAVTLTYTPTSGGNVYTLAIGATTYTETGFAVTLAVAMPIAASSYVYTGVAVGLGAGIGIGGGAYVYNGASINFALRRTVGSAAYNVTGFPVGLGAGINVGAGAYAVTGLPVTLGVGIGISAGAYAVTGSPVGLGAGINIGAGAYTVTGAAVRLDVGMGVSAGSYVYTGATVGLIYVPIGPHPYVLSIGAGAYVYNGVPVGLVYVPFGPPTGAFTVSGKDVACNYGVSGQGAKFGFSNPVNPFATVVLETDR